MARQNGYWVGDQFIETDTSDKTGGEILAEAGKDPSRTLVAVNPRGERMIIDQKQNVKLREFDRFEDLPSFIYG
jgi:hypothetical protein